jgi:hypothetical protein
MLLNSQAEGRSMDVQWLGPVGQFLSGVGLVSGALVAWHTLRSVHHRTVEMNWLQSFRTLYAEFWNDDKMALCRKWIVSEQEYKRIGPLLERRLITTSNEMTSEENDDLECIDRLYRSWCEYTFLVPNEGHLIKIDCMTLYIVIGLEP